MVAKSGYTNRILPEKVYWNTLPSRYPFDEVYVVDRNHEVPKGNLVWAGHLKPEPGIVHEQIGSDVHLQFALAIGNNIDISTEEIVKELGLKVFARYAVHGRWSDGEEMPDIELTDLKAIGRDQDGNYLITGTFTTPIFQERIELSLRIQNKYGQELWSQTYNKGNLVLVIRPNGARLASETSSIIQAIYGERPINPTEAITFIVRVHDATGRTGKLAIGSYVFETEEDKEGRLVIYGFGKELLRAKDYKKIALENNPAEHQVTLSLSDFKLLFDKANRITEETKIGEALYNKKALGIIDLEGLSPTMRGFDEVIVPLLIREMNLAHKRPWGKNAKFLLKGNEELVARVLAQVNAFFPNGQDFIVTTKDGLEDYEPITITTPNQSLEEGRRHFFIQPLQEGDIPNFRAMFKTSLALARVEKLEATDPNFIEIRNALQILLGYEIDTSEWSLAIEARLKDPDKIQRYALPAITRLAISELLKGARLAISMIQQSA